jgi:hypothetical protein
MLDVQTVLRPWSSPSWRVALASTAVALPLHVLPGGARAASPRQPLHQPPQAQIASALDLAADNALPPGYPRLDGVPNVPAVLLKAIAWEESTWWPFQAPDGPLASPSDGYGVMPLTDGIGVNAAGQPSGPRAWAPVPTAVVSPTGSSGPAGVHVARHISLGSADNAAYVADVTIPDGTILAPGQRFTKTWQIQNTGTSTWDGRYHWQFEAGAPLGTVRAVTAPIVPPGATALFSVEMVAPQQPGSYRGFWQMTDPSGTVFGHQAWVLVHVEAGSRATLTPPATWAASGPTATAQPTATMTATVPPSSPVVTTTLTPSSPVGSATVTPSSPATVTTPQPAPPPVAPAPRPTPAPWFGPAVSRAFFADGYTGTGYREYLSLLNPWPRVLRAELTIYRADGATRGLGLRLAPLSRRTLDVNVLAPQASTALKVEMDAPAVVERALYAGNGQMVAGAPLPSRRWYVAEAYVGAGFRDALRIFNPSDLAATVAITAYRGNGSVRLAHRVVAGGTRLNVALDDLAPDGAVGLQIRSSEPTVVESLVNAPRASGPSSAMALVSPSRLWLFPDGGTSPGNQEYIALLNPGSAPATVRLHPVTADGYGRPLRLRVGPHARAVYVLHTLTHRAGIAAVITSGRPIVAQEIRYASSGAVTVVNGAPAPARVWGLAEGYTGGGFKEWITLLNPGAQTATVTVKLIGPHGIARVVRVRERPHHRDYVAVTHLHLLHPGPVAAVVTANRPIVAGRTMIFNADSGLSTTIGVAISD